MLANDTGVSASDGVTSDGTVTVGGIAAGSTYEYSTDGGATWQAGTGETGTGGASFTLPEGTYSDVQVREVDAAGNPGAPTSLGGVTVDTGAPDAPQAGLVQDTGISDADQITSNGTVAVSGLEAGATYEYSTDGGTTWVAGTGTSFTLGAGTYEDVQVRQIDVAGNVGEASSLGSVTVDVSAAAPTPALESDTGTSASDHVTSDGTVLVSGLEDGASYEYSTDGGTTWVAGTGTSFTLGEGTYADVQVRQSDAAGNVSAAASLGAVTVDIPVAVDDASTLNMGAQSSVTQPAQTDTDVQVLGLTESTIGTDNSVTISVPAGDTGSVRIEVDQTALVAVADAYRLDVIDSNGNVVYSAVTPDSLVGDVAGLHVLGLTGNDGLVAIVEGLQPGNYQVVVRNDESALAQLLDTDGGGVSLQELGQAGVVLGPNNQTLVLDAVDNALGGGLLGDTARGLLETTLNLTTNLGVGDLVGILTTLLSNPLINAPQLLDNVLGAVSDTLLSNTLTLLQSTSITTQVTDYSYANETVTGNAIQGGANGGQDHLGGGATITQIANSDGDTVALSATGNTSIVGEYGVLTIAANGAYSYSAFGNPNSAGHSDVFTYTLSDGHSSDTATITVGIQGAAVSAAGDVATAGIHWNNVVDNNYYNANASLIGALGTQTYNSSNIVIGANETVSGSVIVSTTVSALANGVVQIQELTGTNTWTTVGTASYNIGVGVLGQIASINLSTLNLDAGTYRVHTTLNGVLSTLNIATDVNVTYTNQYVHDTSTIATGNILSNDHQGSLVTELEVYNRTTGAYVDVDAGSPVTVAGQYGSLLLNADGSYTYTPYATQSHFTTAQVDSFQYQLVHPSGQIATATLAVTVQPSGAGIPTTAIASTLSTESDTATTTHSLLATTSVGAETVSTEGLTAANDDTASSHALAAKAATSAVAYDMFEGQGSLETVLEGYLDRVHPRTETDTTTPLPTVSESSQDTSIAAVSNDDPLGYLDMHPQILREDQSNHHLQV
ncbi:beta strand repeat-containing protein [Novosphingobium sp. 9]|uniref:beta strand repeat-containing protein n=1 Tax=Novosphingobium sp. 9 TaxID=2025349 RepID=UPI0021B5546E|nr:BapA/Bap/LapF family large adhesin [Novosphingobium sp. 9]